MSKINQHLSVLEVIHCLKPLAERYSGGGDFNEKAEAVVLNAFPGKVATTAVGTNYKWVNCPKELPPAKFVCCRTATFEIEVDDGTIVVLDLEEAIEL